MTLCRTSIGCRRTTNLEWNIKEGGLLGKGYGVKIDYALPIEDLSQIDAVIA